MPAHSDLLTRIRGSIPALITPFRGEDVDESALRRLVEHHLTEGSHGLVPCGTTGESPTLTAKEHARVISIVTECANGSVPVIAGAGSNSTAHAIELARNAKSAGADAVLVVAPYYNKPSQEGLLAHFRAINDAVEIPIVVYNVPARTIADITPETMGEIANLPNVIGLKDASSDLSRVVQHRALAGEGFIQFSGDDGSALGFNAYGGSGCISVTANVAPRLCARLQEASLRGAFDAALAIEQTLAPLHKALFCEPSPAPAKYACSLLGLCEEDVRLPLLSCSESAKSKVRAAMAQAGLI